MCARVYPSRSETCPGMGSQLFLSDLFQSFLQQIILLIQPNFLITFLESFTLKFLKFQFFSLPGPLPHNRTPRQYTLSNPLIPLSSAMSTCAHIHVAACV